MSGSDDSAAFWTRIPLAQLDDEQWESLCDGCGRCCLHKVEDQHDGTVYHTRAACRLLDCNSCRCTAYPRRTELVPRCLHLNAGNLATLAAWLPSSCAYRRLAEGRPLARWHPLLSGNPQSVHDAGVSVRHYAVPEDLAGDPAMQILPELD